MFLLGDAILGDNVFIEKENHGKHKRIIDNLGNYFWTNSVNAFLK